MNFPIFQLVNLRVGFYWIKADWKKLKFVFVYTLSKKSWISQSCCFAENGNIF